MRCECCDRVLSDLEATAKFVDEDGGAPTRFVNMCTKCQSFLPKEVRIITREDLDNEVFDDDQFDQEWNYGYEEE
jgi:hypothetical protein